MKNSTGLIGVGRMGIGIARNFLKEGYKLRVFDLDEAKLNRVEADGALRMASAAQLLEECDIVFLSLSSSEAFTRCADQDLIPSARNGQIIVDTGTTAIPEEKRVAAALADKGAILMDAPVSGGEGGAASGTLRVFAGGDPAVYEKIRPLLEVFGAPEHTAYCGPLGAGQGVKAVNQMSGALMRAVVAEAIAFALRSGASLDSIIQTFGNGERQKSWVYNVASSMKDKPERPFGANTQELPYFLAQARDAGFRMPIGEAVMEFLQDEEKPYKDNMERPYPCYFRALMREGKGILK